MGRGCARGCNWGTFPARRDEFKNNYLCLKADGPKVIQLGGLNRYLHRITQRNVIWVFRYVGKPLELLVCRRCSFLAQIDE